MKFVISLAFLLIAIPALAQQPQPASVVQQLIATDASIKAALAEQLDKANAQVNSLTAQIATLKAENEALKKAHSEPEKKDKK